jgi:hypothetical protein
MIFFCFIFRLKYPQKSEPCLRTRYKLKIFERGWSVMVRNNTFTLLHVSCQVLNLLKKIMVDFNLSLPLL